MKKKMIFLIFLMILAAVVTIGCKKDNTKQGLNEITPQPTVTTVPASTNIPIITPKPTITPTPTSMAFTGPLADTMSKEDFPRVDGSTATIPLSEAVYELATGATPEEAAVDIVHTKTSNSYYRLMNKEVDLLIVYEPSEQVLADIKSGGYHLNIKPIGKDALVFMANSSNPVDSLNEKQLIDIYSGTTDNWSQVGGEDKKIQAFQRPEDSGSQTLMKKLVMKDIPMMTGPNVISFESMEGILKAMADYNNEGNTLGYSVFYYAQNMYHMPELKFMKVNGVEPSLQTIYDNTYPYVNEFYAVIREEEPANSNAHKIFEWLTCEEGQSLVQSLGYVPVNMNISDSTVKPDSFAEDIIPEGYQFIGTSYSSNVETNYGTVTIYDNNWEIKRKFQNAYVRGVTGLVSKEELIPIGYATYQKEGDYSLNYGLYSLKEEKFILPVKYKYFDILDKEKGFYCVSASGKYQVIDLKGNVLASDFLLGEGFGVYKKGDYYWIYDYSSEYNTETYQIYDSDFRLVTEFQKDYNKCELRNFDGTVYFSKDIFLNKYGKQFDAAGDMYLQNFNDSDTLISVSVGGEDLVLNRKLMLLARKPDGNNYSYYNVYNNIFVDYSAEDVLTALFYDKNGKVIKDNEGNTFNAIVNDNYWRSDGKEQILYKYEDGSLNIYDYNTGDQINIPIKDWTDLTVGYVFHDLVLVWADGNQQRTRIYKGNRLLYDLEGRYSLDYNSKIKTANNILLTNYGNMMDQNKYLILNDIGELIYKSSTPENILSMDKKYIQLHRGDYWGVMNYQGDYFVKSVKYDLSND